MKVLKAEQREAFLKAAADLLKPGGWGAVLEWYKKEMDKGPPVDERLSPEEVEDLAKRVGLQPRGWRDLNGKHYLAVLRK